MGKGLPFASVRSLAGEEGGLGTENISLLIAAIFGFLLCLFTTATLTPTLLSQKNRIIIQLPALCMASVAVSTYS